MQLLFLSISLTRYTLSLSVIRQLRNELNERELAAASFQGCTCVQDVKLRCKKRDEERSAMKQLRAVYILYPLFLSARVGHSREASIFGNGLAIEWTTIDRKRLFSQVESNLENENSHERLKTFPSRWLNFRSKKQICFCLKLDVNIYFKSLTSISLRKFIWNV